MNTCHFKILMKNHGDGFFTARDRIPTFAKFEKILILILAAVYTLEVKNDNFRIVTICLGLKYSLGKTKE